jgi:hypothetical protein
MVITNKAISKTSKKNGKPLACFKLAVMSSTALQQQTYQLTHSISRWKQNPAMFVNGSGYKCSC